VKFLDANIFIYAYYKSSRRLSEKGQEMKDQAQKIISDISEGKEEVVTTVVHISEVVNILKKGLTRELLNTTILGLFMLDNLTLVDVTKAEYFAAIAYGDDLNLEPNDALAVDIMHQKGIEEIYSFDKHFDQVEGITRLPIL
jgi:predicted nucleic acid-binding protein